MRKCPMHDYINKKYQESVFFAVFHTFYFAILMLQCIYYTNSVSLSASLVICYFVNNYTFILITMYIGIEKHICTIYKQSFIKSNLVKSIKYWASV